MGYVARRHGHHCFWFAAALWSFCGGLAIVCSGGWGSCRRSTSIGVLASDHFQGVCDECLSGRRQSAADCHSSQPTWDDVSSCSSCGTSAKRSSVEHLGRCGPLGVPTSGSLPYYFKDFPDYIGFGGGRKEIEVWSNPGPTRRWRVLLPHGGLQEQVLREVRGEDGRTTTRLRRSNTGAIECIGKADKNFEDGSVRGLWSLGPVPKAGVEVKQIHHLCFDRGWHFRLEVGSGTLMPCALGGILQGDEDSICNVGVGVVEQPGHVGVARGKISAALSHVLAPCGRSGAQGKIRTSFEDFDKVKAEDGPGSSYSTTGVFLGGPLGRHLENGSRGCGVLAGTGSHPSTFMASPRESGSSSYTCRGDGRASAEWRRFEVERRWGKGGLWRSSFPKQEQGKKRSKEETPSSRTRRATEIERERKRKGWRKRRRPIKILWRGGMLCLEQRQRRLQRARSRGTLSGIQTKTSQVHHMQESRSPFSQLPVEEEVTGRGGSIYVLAELFYKAALNEENKKSEGKGEIPSEQNEPIKDKTSKVGKFAKDSDDRIEGDRVEIDGTLLSMEEYLAERTFTFLHHFAGPVDNLGAAVKEESEKLGLKVRIVSVDEANGDNLLDSEPYVTHLGEAREGHLDGYHSGFPCSSFSVLRWRDSPGMPGPVRSSESPYGIKGQSMASQGQADRGTIMMSRSINMAEAVLTADEDKICPAFTTLENPPPTSREGHISAWDMPEMLDFLRRHPKFVKVNFDTCRYQPEVELGHKTYKPQIFGGNLQGLTGLRGLCQCGDHRHDPVIGKDKSRASGAYPKELCRRYGILAAQHFRKMGQSEFLDAKTRILNRHIAKLKEVAEEHQKEYGKMTPTTPPKRPSYSGVEEAPKKKRKRSSSRSPEPAAGGQASSSTAWVGGRGKYGMVRESKAKTDTPRNATYVGGMRDPLKSVNGLPTVKALGERVHERWLSFVKKYPEVMETAETYGTNLCKIHHDAVDEWRKLLMTMFGESQHKQVFLRPAGAYQTPLDVGLVRSWRERSGDPELHVPVWLAEGAPLGIEREIEPSGVFPPVLDENTANVQEGMSLAELERRGFKNYVSVEDNKSDAEEELSRYERLGFMMRLPKREALEAYPGGTVSRLALVVKVKPDNTKKLRVVIDLRRSGGNAKSFLPEKLILPRPIDAIRTFREQRAKQGKHWNPTDGGFEMALVDISDAFTTLPLHEEELKHAMAPSTSPDEIIVFKALLFGYRTAPLLYSRLAAMISRMVQSFVDPKVAAHQTYLDDSLWILMGSLQERHSNLSLILYTLLAVKMRVALTKGERAAHTTWVGVKFSLVSKDKLVLGLPEKFLRELHDILVSWGSKGYAPLKELRSVAGKSSWLGGILPRAKWTLAIFYGTLKKVEAEELEGKAREAERSKRGLFAVKRLETARAWLAAFTLAAMDNPMRTINIGPEEEAEIRFAVDASPEGLGGILLINHKSIEAFSSPVDHHDEEHLHVTKGSSSSQGTLEALAVLVALRLWGSRFHGHRVRLVVQSDSIVTLALSQKLSSSTPSLNFLGAELALALEQTGVERLDPLHIPGSANKEADYLSRPGKWQDSEKPYNLKDVKVKQAGPRLANFYHLPTLAVDPSMWGASETTSLMAWDYVR